MRSLSILLQESNELPAFISLCEALHQEGYPHACSELTLVYMNPLFEDINIQTGLRYAHEHIQKIKGSKEALTEFINSVFKRLIFAVCCATAKTDESPLKKQACDAICAMEKQVKEICGNNFVSAELCGAQVVLLCVTDLRNFVKIVDSFAQMLACYKKHAPGQFEEALKSCALMMASAYRGIMAYEGKDQARLHEIAVAQMARLNELIKKLDPKSKELLQSIVKKK